MNNSLKVCPDCGRSYAPRLAQCPRCAGAGRQATTPRPPDAEAGPTLAALYEGPYQKARGGPRDNRQRGYERIDLFRQDERLRAVASAFDGDRNAEFIALQHFSVQAEAALDSDARLEALQGSLTRVERLLERLVAAAEGSGDYDRRDR